MGGLIYLRTENWYGGPTDLPLVFRAVSGFATHPKYERILSRTSVLLTGSAPVSFIYNWWDAAKEQLNKMGWFASPPEARTFERAFSYGLTAYTMENHLKLSMFSNRYPADTGVDMRLAASFCLNSNSTPKHGWVPKVSGLLSLTESDTVPWQVSVSHCQHVSPDLCPFAWCFCETHVLRHIDTWWYMYLASWPRGLDESLIWPCFTSAGWDAAAAQINGHELDSTSCG